MSIVKNIDWRNFDPESSLIMKNHCWSTLTIRKPYCDFATISLTISLFSKSLWSAFDQITHISTMTKLIHHPPIRFQFQPFGSKSVSKWPFSRKPISISRSSNSVPKSRFSRKRWALKTTLKSFWPNFFKWMLAKLIHDIPKFVVHISMNSNSESLSFKFSLKAPFCQKQIALKSYF